MRLSRHPYVRGASAPAVDAERRQHAERDLRRCVRNGVGVDFSEYKAPTLRAAAGAPDGAAPARELPTTWRSSQRRPEEVRRSLRGHPHPRHLVLPGSGGLREPEVARLSRDPEAQAGRRADSHLGRRVLDRAKRCTRWPSRCSSSWTTSARRHPDPDLRLRRQRDGRSRRRAPGVYPDSALRDVERRAARGASSPRSRRGYRINKTVRDLCVFVRHDLARDPPFSKLDLVSCRNVLIYFDQALQKRVLPTFHYALEPTGLSAPRPHREHLRVQPAVLGRRQGQQDLRADGGGEHAPLRPPRRGASGASQPIGSPARRARASVPSTWPSTSIACSWRATRRRASSSTRAWRSSSFAATPAPYLRARARRAAEQPPQDGAAGACCAALRATIAQAKKEHGAGPRAGRRGRAGRRRPTTATWWSCRSRACPTRKEQLFVVLFEEAPGRRSSARGSGAPSRTADRRGATPRLAEARARAGRDQGVPAVAHRGARANATTSSARPTRSWSRATKSSRA